MDQTDTYSAVLRGDLDLAITFDYSHAPTSALPGIQEEHLMDDPVMVVLPHGHPLTTRNAVKPDDVGTHECINTNVDVAGIPSGNLTDSFTALDFEGQDFRTVLSLVAAGLGVALLPRLALHHAPPGTSLDPWLTAGSCGSTSLG